MVLKGCFDTGLSLCSLYESSAFGERALLEWTSAIFFLRACWPLSPSKTVWLVLCPEPALDVGWSGLPLYSLVVTALFEVGPVLQFFSRRLESCLMKLHCPWVHKCSVTRRLTEACKTCAVTAHLYITMQDFAVLPRNSPSLCLCLCYIHPSFSSRLLPGMGLRSWRNWGGCAATCDQGFLFSWPLQDLIAQIQLQAAV